MPRRSAGSATIGSVHAVPFVSSHSRPDPRHAIAWPQRQAAHSTRTATPGRPAHAAERSTQTGDTVWKLVCLKIIQQPLLAAAILGTNRAFGDGQYSGGYADCRGAGPAAAVHEVPSHRRGWSRTRQGRPARTSQACLAGAAPWALQRSSIARHLKPLPVAFFDREPVHVLPHSCESGTSVPIHVRPSGKGSMRCLNSGIGQPLHALPQLGHPCPRRALVLPWPLPSPWPGLEVEKTTTSQFIVSVNVTPENVWYALTLM